MATAAPLLKPGNGHPVADNPLRLLLGDFSGGQWGLKDLERNAKILRLRAKHGPITTTEPLQALCPRQRSAEDYTLAVKLASNPTQLAVALFFWPSTFNGANPMCNANSWLLEAEGLPQGDGHKAHLLVRAIRDYDSGQADQWVSQSVDTAGKMLNMEPDVAQVRLDVGEAVKRVAERVIVDFGDTIETSEIDLLNAIDECVRLPEIHGAARAAEAVLQKQLQRVDGYLENAYRLLNTKGDWAHTSLAATDIRSLINGYQEARCAFALLQRRPALLRAMPADRLGHLSAVSVALAFTLGTELRLWDEALQLTSGIDPKNIDPSLDQENLHFLQVACRALPLLRRASLKEDVQTALDQLRHEFPNAQRTINAFKVIAEGLRGGKKLSKLTQSPPAGQSSNNGCGCWVVGIVVLVLWAIFADSCGKSKSSQAPPRSDGYRVSRSVAPALHQQKAALEQQRQSVEALFEQVNRLERDINSSERFLDRSDSFALAEHNRKVGRYNSLVTDARASQSELNAQVDAYNTRLRQNAR